MSGHDREAGSTLLEVLVAFVILAGAVLLSFRIFADGIARLHAAEERSRMVWVARRELARLDLAPALEPGSYSGDDGDGVSWTIEVRPHAGFTDMRSNAVMPFDVSVSAGRKTGKPMVTLDTILLAVPQQ